MMTVYPGYKQYWVFSGEKVYIVKKVNEEATCVQCDSTACEHVQAVAAYIAAGGLPANTSGKPRRFTVTNGKCPICGDSMSWSRIRGYMCHSGHSMVVARGVDLASLHAERPRQTGVDAIDGMTADEYEQYLEELNRKETPDAN